jgi:HK97 family phage major capsid protein
MHTYLTRLTTERDSLTQAATELAERAASDERDLSSTEADSMRAWQTRCAEIDTQLTEYSAQAESARAYATLRNVIDQPADDQQAPRPAGMQTREAQGWGDLFVASDAFRDYPGAGTSRRLELPFDLETRAAISLAGTPGVVPPYVYTPAAYQYASPLLDVVGKVQTNANSVQWVQWAPNPQAAASVVAEEAVKPEATMTPTVVPGTLETVAHWKGITRQALEDIPQIRSTVEGRLRQGLVVALEGMVSTALGAATIPGVSGPTLLASIRSGVATVQAAGYGNPNAVLLNPEDWAGLDVATIGNAGGASGQSAFWGMQAVAVPSVPAGTAYVGNFQTAVQLFTRSAAEVFMTDSHADYFVRNVILLLAEIRALATVPDPAAAAECTVVTIP